MVKTKEQDMKNEFLGIESPQKPEKGKNESDDASSTQIEAVVDGKNVSLNVKTDNKGQEQALVSILVQPKRAPSSKAPFYIVTLLAFGVLGLVAYDLLKEAPKTSA